MVVHDQVLCDCIEWDVLNTSRDITNAARLLVEENHLDVQYIATVEHALCQQVLLL